MADLPIAPGQAYIEVEYDYQYKSKDRLITINQGECYLLVKKTNEDWWQVRKEEGTKAFYVPAQYVREVRKALMPPSKPIHTHPLSAQSSSGTQMQTGAALWVKPCHLDLPEATVSRRESNSKSPKLRRSDSGPLQGEQLAGGHRGGNSSTLPRSRARSPDMLRAPLDVDSTRQCDSAGEERRTNESESGDELSSSSTEQLQSVSLKGPGRSESPVYTNLQELKISQSSVPPLPSGSPLSTSGDWDTYRDQTGRNFYHNHCTQERTWKPPRVREQSGWTGPSREGHSTESSEHNHSPPQTSAEAPKSRSLDRKLPPPIVLTKWRHSAHILEPNEKDAPQGLRPRSPDSECGHSSPKPPSSPSEKCSVLNMTKITEHGKKVRKNWTSYWTVLDGSKLLFAKGQGGGTSWFGGGQPKPELTVELKGGSVETASKDKSSKKHVLELKTRQGMELLIQSDNDSLISDWFRALQESISAHACESDEAIEDDMPESPGKDEKTDKDKEHGDPKKGRAVKTSTSMDVSQDKKTRHKLKKFLTKRPTLQAVRDKGYIKDQVFGCSLSSLCQRESTSVPKFVRLCIEHVETNGLCVDGLYRVSGNLAVIQKLRFAVNHDEKVNLSDGKWEDIHVTTGALKMFFRELPEPLFTYALFHDFVNAIKSSDYKQRLQSIKDLVRQLPKPNHDTMQALFKHLRRVVEHGEENRMTIQSVAIVFGPTLLRPETETWNMAVHMVYQNQIVELILIEYDNIFGR